MEQNSHFLFQSLADNESTNGSGAIDLAASYVKERLDVDTWDLVIMSDGVPTAGIDDYAAIAEKVQQAFDGRAVINALILRGLDKTFPRVEELRRIVAKVASEAGEPGWTINVDVRPT